MCIIYLLPTQITHQLLWLAVHLQFIPSFLDITKVSLPVEGIYLLLLCMHPTYRKNNCK